MDNCSSCDDFQKILDTNEVCIAMFSAQWCGPCRAIKPTITKMAETNDRIKFVYIDIDQFVDQKKNFTDGIKSIPLFRFYKSANKVNECVGSNMAQVANIVESLKN